MEEALRVRTRRARPQDAPALVRLMRELRGGAAAQAEAAVAAALAPGPAGHEAWVAAAADAGVLGFVALEPSSQAAFGVGSVDWVAVAPAARRHGVGLRLLALAQRRAGALGWRQLHAWTFHTNRAALHLYVAAGFYPAATLHDYAGPGLHYVEMVWPVRGPGAAPGRRGGAPEERPPRQDGLG